MNDHLAEHQNITAEKDDLFNKTQKALDEAEEKIKILQVELDGMRAKMVSSENPKDVSSDTHSATVHNEAGFHSAIRLPKPKIVQGKFSVNLCCFEEITESSISFDSNTVQFTGKIKRIL